MAKKAAAQKAGKAQPVKGAAKSNGNSTGKLKNSAKNGLDKADEPAVIAVRASANGGSKAGSVKVAGEGKKAAVEKKSAGNKHIEPVAKKAGQAKPQEETLPPVTENALDQANAIIALKRKLHLEIFEKCLEKKIFQDQDLDFWDQ
jgi:hypothetical protein